MSIARVLTAAALFDGHDVSINIFRRILQKLGAEVINLGHNRSVNEVITVAIQEDVDAILISSYQGGHNEYFRYIIDKLKELNASHIQVFGGGGGVILPNEIEALESYGVTRIYHASEGQKIGIDGIGKDIMTRIANLKASGNRTYLKTLSQDLIKHNSTDKHFSIAQQLTYFEEFASADNNVNEIREILKSNNKNKSLVLGVTG
ncbi:MAG: cobalamin-dependent protein, partial [Candidatus Kapabacteria bacterium]|nr:cobalamin-dependent protein [Candidatus Kapabacteria bacterium]